MEKLYVLYDPNCELCERLKDWLLIQRSWLGLSMIPAGSETARKLFPELEKIASANDLVVVSDDGQVFLNDGAWIMTLFALEEYREWATRLAHPLLLPLARQAFAALSRNRYVLSRWLKARSPEAIAGELRKVVLEPCALAAETVSDYLQ